MTSITWFRFRYATLVAALVLATACGSSDDTSDPPATPAPTAESAETAADSEPVETEAEPAETAPPAPEPDAEPAGSGAVSIVLNDGRTWALDADMCSFDPDATGPGAAVINIGGSNGDGAELGILDAWPLDGNTDIGTVFLANFVDENEELFILVNGSATMVGGAVEVTADFYNDVFYEDGDPVDGSAVISCTP